MTSTETNQSIRAWIGHDLVDEEGSKIGRIEEVYIDDDTRQPEWIAVATGLLGRSTNFVPLSGLTASDDVLVSPWSKDKVKDSPHVDPDEHLSREEEASLFRHYGLDYDRSRSQPGNGDDATDRSEGGDGTDRSQSGDGNDRSEGRDTSGPTTDDAMTRSEEELRVDTTEREAGRARLRKYIETEHQTVTVPVRKERVQVVTEPITDENRDRAMSGPDLSDEEHEVVLTEEEVNVDKQVVPKERVRLDKEVTTEDRQVDEDLRKERIDVDGDVEGAPRSQQTDQRSDA